MWTPNSYQLPLPRLARLDATGVLHPVMVSGIERRVIIRHDSDRQEFLKRLAVLLPDRQMECYAWVLMKNHVHLLLRSRVTGICQLMRRLLTGYAIYFNRWYRRHRQLFQNRFKSIICQQDVYFKERVRYIHLNPVRARVKKRVLEIFGIERDVLYSRGWRRQRMQARSLFCYWSVNQLSISRTKIAKDLGMTQPGVGYAVSRGA